MRLRWGGEMAGAEDIEEGRESEEVGCVAVVLGCRCCGSLLGLGLVACRCRYCYCHGGKMSIGHSLTLDSTSTYCSRIRSIPSQGPNCGEGLFQCLVKIYKVYTSSREIRVKLYFRDLYVCSFHALAVASARIQPNSGRFVK